MKFRVVDAMDVADASPPALLVEAAAAYSAHCCTGELDLWRDRLGYWHATLTHDAGCAADDPPPHRRLVSPRSRQRRPAMSGAAVGTGPHDR